jgi:hypothetical protein
MTYLDLKRRRHHEYADFCHYEGKRRQYSNFQTFKESTTFMAYTVTAFKVRVHRKRIIFLNSKFEIRELGDNC